MANESTIEITIERYNELRFAECILNALQAAGVDNWEGYADAIDAMSVQED